MTANRVWDLLAYIVSLYPKFQLPSDQEIRIWNESLAPYDERLVFEALKSHYRESRYFPHLSDLLDGIKKERMKSFPKGEDAWRIAIQIGQGYEPESHDAIQATMDKFGGVAFFGNPNNNTPYARSEFLKTYEMIIQEHLETNRPLLPPPKKVIDFGEIALKRLEEELKERMEKDEAESRGSSESGDGD